MWPGVFNRMECRAESEGWSGREKWQGGRGCGLRNSAILLLNRAALLVLDAEQTAHKGGSDATSSSVSCVYPVWGCFYRDIRFGCDRETAVASGNTFRVRAQLAQIA